MQMVNLGEGEAEEPNIRGQSQRRIRPAGRVDVQATRVDRMKVSQVVFRRLIAHRNALKDDADGEAQREEGMKANSSPEEAADANAGEYRQVKEGQ